MPMQMTPAEFDTWEPHQLRRFDLVDGHPVARPDVDQGASRLTRTRDVAAKTLPNQSAVDMWTLAPTSELGGLCPKDVAEDSEAGAQAVLRLLIAGVRRNGGASG